MRGQGVGGQGHGRGQGRKETSAHSAEIDFDARICRVLACAAATRSKATMLSLISPEHRVPKEHPLRKVKALADEALTELGSTLDTMYSNVGRPSIPPERLLKSMLLMAFYTVRSERMFCEQLDYS